MSKTITKKESLLRKRTATVHDESPANSICECCGEVTPFIKILITLGAAINAIGLEQIVNSNPPYLGLTA